MNDASDRDARLYEALAVYYEAANPDRAAALVAYPDLADALAEHFAEQDRLSALAAPLRPVPAGQEATMPLTGQGEHEVPAAGGTVRYFGDYELIREVARGGMGVVFEARQVSLNRPVALKMILTGILASEDDRRRFRLEAEAVANLDHPHIVPIYEVGEHAGFSYFSMKLIPGGSLVSRLAEFIDRPRDAAEVVATVARAVHHAHQRGILHRDLKPSNVLLDDQRQPHVVDFGLAKRTEVAGEITASGAVMGTPAYMAPEQAMGTRGQITMGTDVYGLGAILYTLLADKAPFAGDSVIETLEQVKLRMPDPPSGAERAVPRDLQTICLKCLEKDPARRYGGAEALALDLERYLRGEPITARRVGRVERAWLWAKRRPAVAALSAATVLAVLAGTFAVIAVQANANRTLTDKNAELAKTNTLLDQQRSRAEQREQQAIDAVKRFRDAVAGEPRLKNNPELEELRKRLLKEPLAFFKSLREQLQADYDARPEALARLAGAAFELGKLTDEIGDKQDALRAYKEARTIDERLARENPTVSRFERVLAASHNNIGVLLSKTGNPAEALAAYGQARAIWERLARDNPTVTEFQSDLAGSHQNIGLLLRDTGKSAEALAAHEQARAINERLSRENPTVPEFQRILAASHNNIGLLLRETGKPAGALAAFERGRAICERLAREYPTAVMFLSDLANTHTNIGVQLHEAGELAGALAAYEQARSIRERLSRENPTVTELQFDLAASHFNIAKLLRETGKPVEAVVAYQQARAIGERLARENPTVTKFQCNLASTQVEIGLVLRETGKPAAALAAIEQARAILERLARENPTIIEFQRNLALSEISFASLLADVGKPAEALAANEQARTILARLAREHPKSPELASSLGATLNNLALIDLDAKRFAEAREKLVDAIVCQKRALSANPRNRMYRQFLRNHLNNLIVVTRGLDDDERAAAAQRQLEDLDATDPAKLALDARLRSVLRGDAVKSNAERLQLAYHAYERKRYAASARLFAEALESEPVLANDRERQHAYNAACSAALAAAGKSAVTQPSLVDVASTSASATDVGANRPDEAEKPLPDDDRSKLRDQARSWLQAELARWAKLLESPNEQQRAFIRAALEHWLRDVDLVSVRDGSSLDGLPSDEREQWRHLWADVRKLLNRAASGAASRGVPAMSNGTDAPR